MMSFIGLEFYCTRRYKVSIEAFYPLSRSCHKFYVNFLLLRERERERELDHTSCYSNKSLTGNYPEQQLRRKSTITYQQQITNQIINKLVVN